MKLFKLPIWKAWGLLLCLLAPTLLWADDDAININALRLFQNSEKLRAVFDLDKKLDVNAHKVAVYHNPERVVLDIYNANIPSADKLPSRGSFLDKLDMLYNIRLARTEERLRVVFDVNYPAKVQSFVLRPDVNNRPYRLVLDLSPVDKKIVLQNAGNALPNKILPADGDHPQPSNTTKTKPAKVIKPSKPKWRNVVVAIDAGHGGEDSGGHYFGYKEKDIVLQIARKLAKKINAIEGMSSILTRDSDVKVPLRERWGLARKHKADVLISLHTDAYKSFSRARGASVYVLSLAGLKLEANSFLERPEGKEKYAEGENEYIGNIDLTDQSQQMTEVLLDLAQAASMEQSMKIGEAVRKKLSNSVKMHGDHIRSRAFMVLRVPDMPSILVETGFLSHHEDAKLLVSDAYQQKIVAAIAAGLKQHFQEYALPGTHVGRKQP